MKIPLIMQPTRLKEVGELASRHLERDFVENTF